MWRSLLIERNELATLVATLAFALMTATSRAERSESRTGATIEVVSVKNKVAPPLRRADLQLVYGQGFVGGREHAA